jgi:hypothetical protein
VILGVVRVVLFALSVGSFFLAYVDFFFLAYTWENSPVQPLQKGGTENNGVHFSPEEDAMVIQLGVVCTGTVRVKECLKQVNSQWAYAFPIQHNLQLQSQGDVAADYREEEGKASY